MTTDHTTIVASNVVPPSENDSNTFKNDVKFQNQNFLINEENANSSYYENMNKLRVQQKSINDSPISSSSYQSSSDNHNAQNNNLKSAEDHQSDLSDISPASLATSTSFLSSSPCNLSTNSNSPTSDNSQKVAKESKPFQNRNYENQFATPSKATSDNTLLDQNNDPSEITDRFANVRVMSDSSSSSDSDSDSDSDDSNDREVNNINHRRPSYQNSVLNADSKSFTPKTKQNKQEIPSFEPFFKDNGSNEINESDHYELAQGNHNIEIDNEDLETLKDFEIGKPEIHNNFIRRKSGDRDNGPYNPSRQNNYISDQHNNFQNSNSNYLLRANSSTPTNGTRSYTPTDKNRGNSMGALVNNLHDGIRVNPRLIPNNTANNQISSRNMSHNMMPRNRNISPQDQHNYSNNHRISPLAHNGSRRYPDNISQRVHEQYHMNLSNKHSYNPNNSQRGNNNYNENNKHITTRMNNSHPENRSRNGPQGQRNRNNYDENYRQQCQRTRSSYDSYSYTKVLKNEYYSQPRNEPSNSSFHSQYSKLNSRDRALLNCFDRLF